MITGLNFALATAIMRDGEAVSPLAYAIPSGSLQTETIIECNANQQVYVQVIMSASVGFIPCSFRGIPLTGFPGRLDFRI